MSNYILVVNGGEEQTIHTKDALAFISAHQMHLKNLVREMTWSNKVAHIVLKSGEVFDLRPAPEVEEWSTARTSTKMHRFNTVTNRAVCNKNIYVHRFPGDDGYRTYPEVKEGGYKICSRCEKGVKKAGLVWVSAPGGEYQAQIRTLRINLKPIDGGARWVLMDSKPGEYYRRERSVVQGSLENAMKVVENRYLV